MCKVQGLPVQNYNPASHASTPQLSDTYFNYNYSLSILGSQSQRWSVETLSAFANSNASHIFHMQAAVRSVVLHVFYIYHYISGAGIAGALPLSRGHARYLSQLLVSRPRPVVAPKSEDA